MAFFKFKSPLHIFFIKRKGIIYSRRNKKGLGVLLFLFFFIFIIMFIFEGISKQLLPTIIALSEAKAKYVATEIASQVVNEKLGKLNYNDLVYLQKDQNSKITALQTNIVRMNQISADMASAMQEKMSKLDSLYINVPIGNAFKNPFFTNRGPMITVKIIPYGNIDTDFKTEFVTGGINQTKHKIYLEIKTKMIVVVPLVKKGTEIVTTVPVAETVIVGDVPESFFNVQ